MSGLSDEDLLDVFLSGVMSGAGTVFAGFLNDHDEAMMLSQAIARKYLEDPAVRDEAITSIKQMLASDHRATEPVAGVWL